jgi:hypothetical protein
MQGEEHAWRLLAEREPQEVCGRTGASYLADERSYVVPVFGHPVTVDLRERLLRGTTPEAEFVLTKTAYFSRLSILRYLLDAQNIKPTGRLLKPTELKSGQIYLKGSHLLPLEAIAGRFGSDLEGFFRQGARYGAEPRSYGDAALELLPFVRVPITVILWREDEEFPARCYLLFDETCELHLPPDILWSVAMMSALVLIKG